MRCLLSGNDFCGSPEAIACHTHQVVRLILSTHNNNHALLFAILLTCPADPTVV